MGFLSYKQETGTLVDVFPRVAQLVSHDFSPCVEESVWRSLNLTSRQGWELDIIEI